MSEQQKLLGFAQVSPDSPGLEFLLHGCTDDNERNVVRYAFHAFARGDPGGFSIQFAVLLLVASKEETASKRNYAALACWRADSAADPLRYDSICTEGAPASLLWRLAKKELLVWFA
jgi:hypothetical protein